MSRLFVQVETELSELRLPSRLLATLNIPHWLKKLAYEPADK